MVIAKILKSNSGSFSGIDYNEKKIEEGIAEILQISNIPDLNIDSNSKDVKTFLQIHSDKNERVKGKQLHLTISTKGKEKSFEELKEFANHYMEKMGYGKNPSIMYAHKDTDNNHIHIVSSRIDNEGLKINDSFERLKSQAIILNYYAKEYSINQKLKELNKYKFTTESQYRLLLEKNFSKVIVNDKNYKILHSTKSQSLDKPVINKEENKKFFLSKKIRSRKAEVQNIIKNLSQETDLKHLNPLLKKEGIELEFFKRKDTGEINGYTVIDHKNKTLYKGSEIISLNKLNDFLIKTSEKEAFINSLKDFKLLENSKLTINDINKLISDKGYEINKEGEVFKKDDLKFKSDFAFKVPKKEIFEFLKNSNIEFINKDLKPTNLKELEVLSALFKVKRSDIKLTENDPKLKEEQKQFYEKFFENFENVEDKKGFLKDNSISILKFKDEYYVLDDIYKNMVSINLNDNIKNTIEKEGLFIDLKDFSKGLDQSIEKESFNKHINGMLGYEDSDDATQKNKKKKNKSKTR